MSSRDYHGSNLHLRIPVLHELWVCQPASCTAINLTATLSNTPLHYLHTLSNSLTQNRCTPIQFRRVPWFHGRPKPAQIPTLTFPSLYLIPFMYFLFPHWTVSGHRGKDLEAALGVAAALLPAYETILGVPYPLAKLDLVAIPDFAAGAHPDAPGLRYWCCAHRLSSQSIVSPELPECWNG